MERTISDKTVNDCHVGISGYQVICKDRNYGGGVLMYRPIFDVVITWQQGTG